MLVQVICPFFHWVGKMGEFLLSSGYGPFLFTLLINFNEIQFIIFPFRSCVFVSDYEIFAYSKAYGFLPESYII
jgi:hypothetical protein